MNQKTRSNNQLSSSPTPTPTDPKTELNILIVGRERQDKQSENFHPRIVVTLVANTRRENLTKILQQKKNCR